MYNSNIVYVRIGLPGTTLHRTFITREFGRATFITRVKSPRSFSREIERSGLTRNMHSQSLLLRLTRFELPSSGKLRPLGTYFFAIRAIRDKYFRKPVITFSRRFSRHLRGIKKNSSLFIIKFFSRYEFYVNFKKL